MALSKPYFSVVIPTYNRAHLLPLAVRSVLTQSIDDFEIVISNGGSVDNTAEVARGFGDERIRYIESEKRLSAAENYQAGLEHASGDFITFLSDDDAYTPDLLKRVHEILAETNADVVGYQYCRYYHDDICDFELNIPGNSLLISKFNRAVTRFNVKESLEQVMALHALSAAPVHPRFICPYLSNATYRRGIFDALRRKRKNLFDTVPADIYLAAAVFYEADSYYCLDEPLLVWSNWEGNSTASAQRIENKVSQHYKRLLNGRELEHTPLKFPLALNCGANAVLEAVKDNGDVKITADWPVYFAKTYENFIYLRSVGVDTSAEEREFRTVLAQQPEGIRRAVDEKVSGFRFKAKAFLNSRMPYFAARLRKLKNWNSQIEPRLILGEVAGFNNVLEASKYVL